MKKCILVDMSATLIHHGHIRLLKEASQRGEVIDVATNFKLGKTREAVYSSLIDPLNEEILRDLIDKVEEYWNK